MSNKRILLAVGVLGAGMAATTTARRREEDECKPVMLTQPELFYRKERQAQLTGIEVSGRDYYDQLADLTIKEVNQLSNELREHYQHVVHIPVPVALNYWPGDEEIKGNERRERRRALGKRRNECERTLLAMMLKDTKKKHTT